MRKILSVFALTVALLGGAKVSKADPKTVTFDAREIPENLCKDALKNTSTDTPKGACLDSFNECKKTLTVFSVKTAQFKKFYQNGLYEFSTSLQGYQEYEKQVYEQHQYSEMTTYKNEPGEIPYTGSFEYEYHAAKNDLAKKCAVFNYIPGFVIKPQDEAPAKEENPGKEEAPGTEEVPTAHDDSGRNIVANTSTPSVLLLPQAPSSEPAQKNLGGGGCSLLITETRVSTFEAMWALGLALIPGLAQWGRRKNQK